MDKYSDLPLLEITLRKYELPHNLSLRDTLKKICLSIGLLQPGDSRDVIVDILFILELAKVNKELLTSEEIKKRVVELRKNLGISINGTADSNIRRQLKRLRDKFLVEKVKNNYRILENLPLKDIFDYRIKKLLIDFTLSSISQYFEYYEEKYKQEVENKNDKE